MALAVVAGVVGDLFLSKGMKDIGDASTVTLKTVGPFLQKVVCSPKIWLGTAFLAGFFVLWLTVLSWADLSIALPLQAATFILGPLMAQILFGESSTTLRWTGTFLISVGVILVTLGEPQKPQLPNSIAVGVNGETSANAEKK
jgi:drug/metabolite transporter (DMT)-like permease